MSFPFRPVSRGRCERVDRGLLNPGGSGGPWRGRHQSADDPEDREDDSEPEQGGVALAERHHAERDERGDVNHREENPEERHGTSFRTGPSDVASSRSVLRAWWRAAAEKASPRWDESAGRASGAIEFLDG